ncbi:6-phosphofructokinase [Thermovirga lienii DSM 17291]|uniref:ATP-dependent 6-phosphofructokinase n=1 Tax=Thermovirga lienii (strain ATCC BAA-1197 / DSM 17291 / Cas60314) TaxID=580340 RepID=G7V8E8_THELD|nr:6-phosphofructokinase [Thermovirga lienii]AER66310.1 6-phosphofructokinase [Thermovirga lienii DSM 17291]
MKKIAILTSGGDAPGMNAAIRAVTRSAIGRGLTVYGFMRGYEGLLDRDFRVLSARDVGGIIHRGGTILQTARSDRFMESFWQDRAAEFLKEEGIEGLVVIGGDGSFRGAAELAKRGISVVGVPGTIDNDIAETDLTIGFRTAVETALDAVKRLRDTASSHDRLFIVEVMGRRSGFIALEVGVASGAEAVLVPEVPFSLGMLNDKLHAARKKGKTHSLIILAEGVMSAQELKTQLKDTGGYEARVTVLGHIQRGGSPCSVDIILASQMGKCAVDALLEGETAVMAASRCGKVQRVPLSWSWERRKLLDPDLMELVEVLSI